jgi:Na+-translocating ferredoxin:NAD+ oxidoreductase subunit B
MPETNAVYTQLAIALDRLPNGFPLTTSGVEIHILEKIFSPEEASLAVHLTGIPAPIAEISERSGLSIELTKNQLIPMAKRGLVWFEARNGKPHFRLAPFIVGIYEAQIGLMDHELAHLVEAYMYEGGAVGIMAPQPALHRVMPAQHSVKSEWILPYDDVRALLLNAKTFNNGDCICRAQKGALGQGCSFPKDLCLGFSMSDRSLRPGDITQVQALDILARAEDLGLVHTVSNVTEGMGYICNCCGCCCAILRGINEFGIANSVAHANYYAVIEADLCAGCGTCIDRCQVHAITDLNGISWVDRARCIGCGLCVTGCPNDVARLERKPESETIHPPANFTAWEQERLRSRGLAN